MKIKKIHLFGIFALAAIFIVSISLAFKMGQRSPIYATGTVVLDKSLTGDLEGVQSVFIILYDDSINKRMPYGVVKYSHEEFMANNELKFIITPDNVQQMFPGKIVPKNFRIKVRLDKDGFGGPDKDGDLVGQIQDIAYGTKDIKITVDRKIVF